MNTKIKTIAAAAALLIAVPGAASALTLYGANGNGSGSTRGDILVIDPTDVNNATTLGNAISGAGITGIDFDNAGALWGSTISGAGSTSSLIQISPVTGTTNSVVGPIQTNGGDVLGSAISIGDLAYNRAIGTMFGITSNASGVAAGGDIYTIDLGSGLATFVGSTIWGTSAGLAFDGAGTLYALGFDPNVGGGTNMLFTLDTSDASETSRLTVSHNDFLYDGLAINPLTGEIYATEGQTGNVFAVNGTNGAMTFIGNPTNGKMSDLAFRVPEPGTLAVFGLGIAGMAYYRRRRAG
jgi:hypothetical protein